MRDTFMKVAQSLIVKKQLVNEKSIKEKMIHSVMPPKVADWLMNEGHAEGMDEAMFGADGVGKGGNGNAGPNNNATAANAAAGGGAGRRPRRARPASRAGRRTATSSIYPKTTRSPGNTFPGFDLA